MIATLKNIGSIKEGMFDLDKNLLILIGPNNTGKTYASYCLYGLKKFQPEYKSDFINDIFANIDFIKLFDLGVLDINLEQLFTKEVIDAILKEFSSQFKEFLPILFGSEKDFFENSRVDLQIAKTTADISSYLKQFRFRLGRLGYANTMISFNKDTNSSLLKLSLERQIIINEDGDLNIEENEEDDDSKNDLNVRMIKESIIEYTLRPFIQNHEVFFIPAERIGISVFSKDLFANRFTRSNELLKNEDLREEDFINNFNTYSVVIQDSLQNYESILRRPKRLRTTTFAKLADELENKVLKGKLRVAEDGLVYYDTDNSSFKIQTTGSIIKSLINLVFFLRYSAIPGSLLIIDEPEINLHPDNQRIVARILAKLSNQGVKVIISTHSDYFIKELNNLMMLGKEHKESSSLLEKYGYQKEEVLNYRNVGGYLFINNEVQEIDVTEKGIEAATIDEQINQLNSSANDIYWTLFEDE